MRIKIAICDLSIFWPGQLLHNRRRCRFLFCFLDWGNFPTTSDAPAQTLTRVRKRVHVRFVRVRMTQKLFNATFWHWISLRNTSKADVQTSNAM
jgi:hypothetical protein